MFIPNDVTKLTFRMLATLKFVLFNVVLSTTDVDILRPTGGEPSMGLSYNGLDDDAVPGSHHLLPLQGSNREVQNVHQLHRGHASVL